MPRGPRRDAPGAHHHVIVRGIEKRPIFRDDADREDLLARIARIFPSCGVACFAWAFMPNHVHLVVRTGDQPLALAMARVNTGYARYFNERHGRVGHLFQNRYKAIPVLDEAHLFVCVRYVHLNPLRAGLVPDVESLARFRWTGYAVLMGTREASFERVDDVLERFEGTDEPRRALAAWMAEGDPAAQPEALCVRRLVEMVCQEFSVAPQEIAAGRRGRPVSAARRALAHLAHRRLGLSPPALAPILGVSRQACAQAIRRGEALVDGMPSLARLLES